MERCSLCPHCPHPPACRRVVSPCPSDVIAPCFPQEGQKGNVLPASTHPTSSAGPAQAEGAASPGPSNSRHQGHGKHAGMFSLRHLLAPGDLWLLKAEVGLQRLMAVCVCRYFSGEAIPFWHSESCSGESRDLSTRRRKQRLLFAALGWLCLLPFRARISNCALFSQEFTHFHSPISPRCSSAACPAVNNLLLPPAASPPPGPAPPGGRSSIYIYST